MVVRQHQPNHLPCKKHVVLRKNGFVVCKSGEHWVTGDIAGQHHIHHARQSPRGFGVNTSQTPMRHARHNGCGMKRAL